MKLRRAQHFGLLLLAMALISGNPRVRQPDRESPFAPISSDAADSLLAGLSLEQKLEQFFVTESSIDSANGAVIVPYTSLHELAYDGTASKDLIGIDLIKDQGIYELLSLPKAPILGSVRDPKEVEEYAHQLGLLLRTKGVDFVVGPSLDIEFNDESPFSQEHSFGNDPESVAERASAFVEGMRSAGIISVAGHFPGLGNTTRGADPNPPMVYSKRNDLIQKDLVPFKRLINDGLQGVLIANAYVPGMDSSLNTTASVSRLVHSTLTNDMGFNGVSWCDLSRVTQNTNVHIKQAFLAGNDVLIVPSKEEAIKAIHQLIDEDILKEEEVNTRCKRVLQFKLWSDRQPLLPNGDFQQEKEVSLELKNRKLYSSAVVLLKNDGVLPFTHLDTVKLAVVRLSDSSDRAFPFLVTRYAPAEIFEMNHANLEEDLETFMTVSDEFDHVIILAEPSSQDISRKRFGLSEHAQSVIERIASQERTSLIWNGNAKAMRFIGDSPKLKCIIIGHETNQWSADLSLQAFFGGRAINGQLKRKIDARYKDIPTLETPKIRLGFGIPEEVGIDRTDLKKVDTIAEEGIKEMAYPGCQVWFAKDGIVVLNNTYGHHTYQNERPVKQTDLYDLASITKIASSVSSLMKLSDEGRFNLDYNLCDYLPEWVDTTHYMQLNMREILAHQAGLTPWIPFYTKTVTKGIPRYDVYSLARSEIYPHRVAREFYIRDNYPDQMFRQILNHKLSPNKKYKYSDIGYYFALRIIEKLSDQPLEEYVDSAFYKPLGLATMGYRPLNRFEKREITPTEYDRVFRKQLVHGDVHDPGAAMLGGVGGHAGLFSNANDLGTMMQMMVNGGEYGGKTYLSPETIAEYTKCQFCENDNRRGAGFDKPLTDGTEGPSCGCTTLDAFGHQGFTGTVTWADPEEKVVYVFLSNRVYPDAGNRKLLELNTRTEIQKAFYTAIKNGEEVADSSGTND